MVFAIPPFSATHKQEYMITIIVDDNGDDNHENVDDHDTNHANNNSII